MITLRFRDVVLPLPFSGFFQINFKSHSCWRAPSPVSTPDLRIRPVPFFPSAFFSPGFCLRPRDTSNLLPPLFFNFDSAGEGTRPWHNLTED